MRHVLITGGTGVLGSAIVPLFLAEPTTRITLLLRASSPEKLDERLRGLVTYYHSQGHDISWSSRMDAVSGDVGADDLGIRPEKFAQLGHEITHIVHSAGNVKLNQSMDAARKTAVTAAKSIIDLAHRSRANGQFRKLEFVSTVGVAGRRTGLVPEEPFRQPRTLDDFHNTYEAAKWEAECLVWEQIDKGLPVTVHRPSMIVGDSKTGKIMQFQVFYFLMDFFLGKQTWGIVPRTNGTRLDIVPVDFVARAVHQSAVEGLAMGQVLHLCSGPDRSWQLDELTAQVQILLTQRGKVSPRLTRLSPRTFRRLLGILQRFVPSRSRRFLQGLPFLLDYLDEKQLFDNVRSRALLSSVGIEVPAVADYLGPVMRAYWDDQDLRVGSLQ